MGAANSENFSKLVFERTDNPPRELQHLSKQRNKRSVRTGFVWNLNDYLSGRFSICLEARIWLSKDNSHQFYTVFSHRTGLLLGEDAVDNGTRVLTTNGRRSVSVNCDLMHQADAARRDKQQSVLVPIVHLMKGPQRRFFGHLADNVRLYREDEIGRGRGDRLFQSALTGFFVFFLVDADGKCGVPSWFTPYVLDDKRVGEVIQRGTQLVNDFPSENREANGNVQFAPYRKDILRGIRLELSDYGVRGLVIPQEGLDLSIELVDIFFGPLDLGGDTI